MPRKSVNRVMKYVDSVICRSAGVAFDTIQFFNKYQPNASFIPKWSDKPLLKSWEKSKPTLGWPRTTDSLCPNCVMEAREKIINGEEDYRSLMTDNVGEIKAQIIERNGEVWMVKECPKHGKFEDMMAKDVKFLEWIEQNLPVLQKMGIGIEGFGPNTFKIDSMPGFVKPTDAVSFMQAVIDELKSASNSSSPLRLGEDMIATTVCRHAVKANDPLRYPELEKLIRDLLECDLPYCCPHGRPTMIQISLAELEKKFGRKV